jgi:hypothetical protein
MLIIIAAARLSKYKIVPIEPKGGSRWYIILRITGGSVTVHSSWKAPTVLGPLERANLDHYIMGIVIAISSF